MAISEEIERRTLEELSLDPTNPRLGRGNAQKDAPQSKVLELMREWDLEELAASFLESGFWPQEALIVVEEPLYGKRRLVVVEGNRRLAALKYLKLAFHGDGTKKWQKIVEGQPRRPELFAKIPVIRAEAREDVDAFLGFRHVTGIKEWHPAEKAEYITKLIEQRRMGYEEVMRKIGSKTPAVRQHYISFKLLLQMEDQESISVGNVEEKFSVLYLSLRTEGVQKYLQIDIVAPPQRAKRPVPATRLKQLANFAKWLFGDDTSPPLFTDSRKIDDFGRILASPKAVAYLERTDHPKFEVAYRTAGGDEPETVKLLETAADNVELALAKVHFYTKSQKVQLAAARLGTDALQLLKVFPTIRKELLAEEG